MSTSGEAGEMSPGAPRWLRAAQAANLQVGSGAAVSARSALTIFESTTARALATGAVNLGQGAPEISTPFAAAYQDLLEDAEHNISAGLNQYAPGSGMPELRDSIAAHQKRFYGYEVDAVDEVLVTTGATEGIAASILALCEPGDEVVLIDPFYDSYAASIALAGAKMRNAALKMEHGSDPEQALSFTFDVEALRAVCNAQTRLIVLNNPHNPTGKVFTAEELTAIIQIAQECGALILSDEVYEHLLFDGAQHIPVASLPGARERTITLSSAGKTFSVTGWKVGWLSGPADVVAQIRTVKQFLTFSSGTPFQPAVARALAAPKESFVQQAAIFEQRRDVLLEGLRSAGFAVAKPAAGYFIVADTSALGADDGAQFCRQLPEAAGVAAIPVSVFCAPENQPAAASLVRFAFCKSMASIQEASRRLSAWQQEAPHGQIAH